MENKYQTSLNRLKDHEEYIPSNEIWEKPYGASQDYSVDIDTLQELIDNYSKLEELNNELKIRIQDLDTALDIACQKYADMKDNYRIDYLKQGCVETRWRNWKKVKSNILKELGSEKE